MSSGSSRLASSKVGASIYEPTWHEFRDRYTSFGGDGIYAAWKLTYLESMFEKMNLLGRRQFITEQNRDGYRKGLCPVAERLQPRLLQFNDQVSPRRYELRGQAAR
jgi:hypothetical protein